MSQDDFERAMDEAKEAASFASRSGNWNADFVRELSERGYGLGPTHCPIGLDASPMICSAGYCLACLWIKAHWDDRPKVELSVHGQSGEQK